MLSTKGNYFALFYIFFRFFIKPMHLNTGLFDNIIHFMSLQRFIIDSDSYENDKNKEDDSYQLTCVDFFCKCVDRF